MAIMLTKKAEDKVKEILSEQPEPYAGLRIQVVGGGCSGFQYRMGFDKAFNDQNDAIFEFGALHVKQTGLVHEHFEAVELEYRVVLGVERLIKYHAGFKASAAAANDVKDRKRDV